MGLDIVGLEIAEAPKKAYSNAQNCPILKKFTQAKFVSNGSLEPFRVSNLGARDVSMGIFSDLAINGNTKKFVPGSLQRLLNNVLIQILQMVIRHLTKIFPYCH